MVSVGRIPNSFGLGLEDLGIEISERGHVVDDDNRIPSVHAVGDYQAFLVNVGELEGRQAIDSFGNQLEN